MCPQEHKSYAVAFNAIAFFVYDAHGHNGVALMFSALAARYGVSPYVSLATRTLVRGQPRSGLLCILCKLLLLMSFALSG